MAYTGFYKSEGDLLIAKSSFLQSVFVGTFSSNSWGSVNPWGICFAAWSRLLVPMKLLK